MLEYSGPGPPPDVVSGSVSNAGLMLLTLAVVAGLILLVARFKLNAFIALLVASLTIGLLAGAEPRLVAKAVTEGFGAVLGSIAAIVGLGTILGRLLALSGGAEVVAARLLVAYHLAHQRPMMAAFLDALGIAHEDGLISDEDMEAPSAERLAGAAKTLGGSYAAPDVALYLSTLMWQDPDTWGGLEKVPESRAVA